MVLKNSKAPRDSEFMGLEDAMCVKAVLTPVQEGEACVYSH